MGEVHYCSKKKGGEGKEGEGKGKRKDENDGRIQETNAKTHIRISTHLLDKEC